ncbi:MAG: SDR family NAD(P)-dependent oxidoreductase [Candidatus Aquicultorales bacterium]
MSERTVLITGASSGIGAATAQAFKNEGWRVIGAARRQAPESFKGDRYFKADISDPSAVTEIFREVRNEFGRLDALVNNAALQVSKPILETTLEEWDAVMSVNIRSVFLCVKEAHPLLSQRGGAIVNVSSVHAMATSRGLGAYAASKGALLAFTRSLALELAPEIRVNAILPGAVRTAMLEGGLGRGHVAGDEMNERLRQLGERHALGRIGEPEEIAKAIVFLADNESSSFMTGQALVVDGGALARLSTE